MPPTFREAFWFWFTLGWISFGGPAGQIAVMHQELVDKKKWVSEERFLHALNYCMLLPGPEAQQLATYCGWMLHGTRGGITAGLLFILPSFFILGGLSWIYLVFGHVPAVACVLLGFKAAVVAIVLQAMVRLSRKAIKTRSHALIALGAFLLLEFTPLPFPCILLLAALAGGWMGRKDSVPPSVPFSAPPPNLWNGLRQVIPPALILWGLPLVVFSLTALPLFQSIACFFTKLALVTFGGAYAVLPYLTTQATTVYGWLTPPQMIDGLALGETTPGPLIMIVTYVGFLAGWPGGPGLAWLGAATATYYTFLPSFVFVLLGAPWVERLPHSQWPRRMLSGITTAVLGIMAALAVFFAQHVFWPQGIFDGLAAGLSGVALLLLLRFQLNILWLIPGCGAAAWALRHLFY